MTPRGKILFIPHVSSEWRKYIKIRSIEIAKEFSHRGWDVYVVSRSLSKVRDVVWLLRNIRFVTEKKEGLTFIRVPYLPALFQPFLLFNAFIIKTIAERLGIHVIVNSSPHSYAILKGHYIYVYDVVDEHSDAFNRPISFMMKRFEKNEIKKADLVTTVSPSLEDKIMALCKERKDRILLLTNGTDPLAFRRVNEEQVSLIREKFKLKGKIVIGHIGNHGPRSGLEFLIDFFLGFHQRNKNSVLLIVGPGTEIEKYKRIYNSEIIIFTGPVRPSDVAVYFKAIDLGVLPFSDTSFIRNSFPIVFLDYLAAGKPVLTWPFSIFSSEKFKFPNLVIANRKIDDWVEAVDKALNIRWDPTWDVFADSFSWDKIAGILEDRLQRPLLSRMP